MLDTTLFAETYHIEGIVECSALSMLCQGRNNKTGEPVLVRRWLTTYEIPEKARQSIQAEVKTWQACQSLHLLPLLEVSASEQGIYLVSAFASGGTLTARLAQHFLTVLPLALALRIITQIGQALETLHRHGLSHGHLSPQAVFFNPAEQVCLGEYRLPSVLACLPNYQPALEESIPLCWYMAPEQFAGVYDALTDQYALGCLAYHMLAGRVPFTGTARATLLQKHTQEQPGTLRELNPAVPASVEEAVLKALAKRPEERHSSIQAFLDTLLLSLNTPGSLEMDSDPCRVDGIDITEQTMLVPEAFHPSLSSAPGTPGDDQQEKHPSYTLALADEKFQVGQFLPQPAPGGAGPSTHWRDATTLRMQSVTGGKKRPNLFARRRELIVLGSAALLVLVLAGLVGHWLLFSHPSSQRLAGKPTPYPTQLSPGKTPTSATVPV
ncbi:MAG TPA: serine/threonine-protein kinase, partial [Ktedonobacteraceae bacterium]|nr:serine/threonine-protein kinase [Ktedonobacteraceae bacterium]